ncbi:hypothetical protein ACTQ42_06550 [Streptococcus alactolyticus]|uniref:hypothetical protein n=1 Tax=Streptococcus alactolyticus TaxID=29389 RepID=UPI003F98C2D1
MQFNFFSILWSILILFALGRPSKFMGYLFLTSFIFQANCFMIIGTQAINISLITGVALIIHSIVLRPVIPKNRKFFLWVIFLFITIGISLYSSSHHVGIEIYDEFYANGVNQLVTNPYDGSTGVYRFLILAVYILAVIQLPRMLQKSNSDEFMLYLKRLIEFVLIIGAIQYILIITKSPITELFEMIFETDPACVGARVYFRIPRLFSTFTEPSYCATFLASSFWACIVVDKRYGMTKLLPFILIEILLTFSTTAYIATLIGAIYYLVKIRSWSALRNISVLVIVATIGILATGKVDYIIGVVADKFTTNSGLTRAAWNQMALQNFLETNGIGMGYRTIRASSLLFNLLGQIGVIGFVMFFVCIWFTMKDNVVNFWKNDGSKFAVIFIVITIISEIISCPDIDNCILWLAIAMNIVLGNYSAHIKEYDNINYIGG